MRNIKDVIVVGFALFAMFFGAGNLIFPPFLGVISGDNWLTGFAGFILADVGLALLAMLAAAKCNGQISKVLSRSGKVLSIVLGCAIMICLGPLLAIPRTAATTFEMGIIPLFNGFNVWSFTRETFNNYASSELKKYQASEFDNSSKIQYDKYIN